MVLIVPDIVFECMKPSMVFLFASIIFPMLYFEVLEHLINMLIIVVDVLSHWIHHVVMGTAWSRKPTTRFNICSTPNSIQKNILPTKNAITPWVMAMMFLNRIEYTTGWHNGRCSL